MNNDDRVDWESFQELLTIDDDPGFFADQVRTFISYTSELNHKMGIAIAKQDALEISRVAHSMRSSALNFGAKKVNQICAILENQVSTLSKDAISSHYHELQKEIEQFYSFIRFENKKREKTHE